MAYDVLKTTVQNALPDNTSNEISAADVRSSILAVINSLGAEFQFSGEAKTTDAGPGTPDYKVAYLASTPGTYSNFGGIVVNDGEVAILKWAGSWSKEIAYDSAQILADISSQIRVERGGLDTSSGAEQNSSVALGRRVRTHGFFDGPATIAINSGFRVGALLKYDKHGTFISSTLYPSSAPFTTALNIPRDGNKYRVLFTKEDATQDFTDAEVTSLLKSFSGSFDVVDSRLSVVEKNEVLFAPRGAYLKANTRIDYSGSGISFANSDAWDVIVVNVPASADKIKVTNYALARLYAFDSNATDDFTAEHWIGNIPYVAGAFLPIVDGTRAIAILVRKSDYPQGYGGIQIIFNDKQTDTPNNYYTGDVIDLAKKWGVALFENLDTAKTIQSMAHYGDRLFMFGNVGGEVQIHIYNLTTGALIQTLSNVGTGSLSDVHCNVSFFGNEFYAGNTAFPLLYTSQWSGARALLAFNIVENETRDNYTATLVQVIKPGASIPAAAIGAGYMDYIFDEKSNKLVSVSYDVALNGYYDTQNDAHVAIFDMPLLSAGSEIELTSVVDSFRIAPVPVRQDMAIYNGKIYLFSGMPGNGWPAYLTIIDVANKRLTHSILISDAYSGIFGEPEGVDIIANNLIVTSNSNRGKLYQMFF